MVMEKLLDNPVWHALVSGNRELSQGTEDIRFLPEEIGAFAGFREHNPAGLRALHELAPERSQWALFHPAPLDIPSCWRVSAVIDILQMIYRGAQEDIPYQETILPLGQAHVPAMLALTQLTHPGPFGKETIRFGHYRGIFIGDRLAAMAGQRLHPVPYAEISAVCTHPDFQGKGLAGILLRDQIKRVIAESGIPFLHVKTSNTAAVRLYQRLGFAVRRPLTVTILEQA